MKMRFLVCSRLSNFYLQVVGSKMRVSCYQSFPVHPEIELFLPMHLKRQGFRIMCENDILIPPRNRLNESSLSLPKI